jgi:hypothetical protein
VDRYEAPPTVIEVEDSEDDEFNRDQDQQRPNKVLAVNVRDGKLKSQQKGGNDAKRENTGLSEPDGQAVEISPALNSDK